MALWGCRLSSEFGSPIEIITPSGRKEVATQRYSIEEIQSASFVQKGATNVWDVQHPLYPNKEQLVTLKQHLRRDSQLWYFRGLDSGWAVVENGKVVWILVTNHEY